jgi:hypothetical protein
MKQMVVSNSLTTVMVASAAIAIGAVTADADQDH